MKPEIAHIVSQAFDLCITGVFGWIGHSIAKVVSKVNSIDKIRDDLNSAWNEIRKLKGEKNV